MLNQIIKEIKTIIGEAGEVTTYKVMKNNGLELTGITILTKEENIAPTVYLENYDTSENVHVLAKTIITDIAKARLLHSAFNINKIMNHEFIKDNVIFRLINYKANEELLETISHIKYLDLAIVFCVNISENGSYKITNELYNDLDMSKEELYVLAKKNTQRILNPLGRNMETMMLEMMFGLEKECADLERFNISEPTSMYTLTNKEKLYGASVILYDGVLETLANQVGMDLIIIPNSVHELILLPYNGIIDTKSATEMIKEVNRTELSTDEVLSDHAYIYNKITKRVEMA